MNDRELILTMEAIGETIANLEREKNMWRELLIEEHESYTGHTLDELQPSCWVCGVLAGTVAQSKK